MIRKTQKHGMGEKEKQLLLKMTELDCRKICWSEEKYNWATADYPKNTLYPENLKYATKSGRKIEIYHDMGFREHTNLILTTEEDIENPGVLDGIIERFLLV